MKYRIDFTLIIFAFFVITTFAQQGKLDSNFNTHDNGITGDGFDGAVRTLALQSDGKLIVGGEYLNFNGKPISYLCRLNTDGSIDTTFETGAGFNGKIYTSHIQSDGKIIIGGNFTTYNGGTVGRLIRLNTDGSHDILFDTSIGAGNAIIYQIVPQIDGKIIIAGSFTAYNGITVNRIARVLPDGSLDSSFLTGSGTALTITNVAVQSDGKIILAGNFSSFNGISAGRIIRLHSDGSPDFTFNTGTGFNDDCSALFLQSDNKILIGGKYTQYNGENNNRIIRLNEDGSKDSDFLTGSGISNGVVYVIKTDVSGNIMVGGSFSDSYNGTEVNRLILLNPNGTLKSDFDIGSGPASASVLTLSNDLDDSWHIGGSFSVFDSQNQGRLAKIDKNGSHDISYLSADVGFNNSVFKVLPLSDHKVMVFGNFSKYNEILTSKVIRISSEGVLDKNFNSGGTGTNNAIRAAVQQLDEKLIIGGSFTDYNGTMCNRIARILPEGELDTEFVTGTGCNGQVLGIALQSDQKILVAGNFTKYNGVTVGRIVRLLQNGSPDPTFDAGSGADAAIEAIWVQADGKILLGGRFAVFNGVSYSRLVRLNSDGSFDSSFSIGTGFDKNVYALQQQSNGKILIGGSFLNYNGIIQKRILRLHDNGVLDTTFESGTGFSNGEVRSILVQPDDRILVGGTFSGNYDGTSSLRLIRMKEKGSYDPSFKVTLNSTLFTMQFTEDNKLLIGGNFNSVSGTAKHRIALLKLCNNSTHWNGFDWSNGIPSDGKELVFHDDYTFSASLNGCSCTIDSGKKVTVLSDKTLDLKFDYTGEGILILEDTASLYQSDDDMINTGTVHVKRKSAPILKFDYTYWSSPVENQKLIDVSPGTLHDKFFSYDYTVKDWYQEIPSSVMTTGRGYIIRGPQSFSTTVPATYETTFKGIPVNGKIKVPIGNPGVFNLIGNPYSSAIDADIFLNENLETLSGTLYFWTHNTPLTSNKYNQNDYAVYNLLGGTGTRPSLSSGINDTRPDGKIASGQSFFVQSRTFGEVKIDNSMRISGNNASFFKPAKNSNNKKEKKEKNRIWLNLSNQEGLFKQLLLGYAEGATNQFDKSFDGEVFNGNPYLNFYSINENRNWIIQGRGLPFQHDDIIPLGYASEIESDFSISIDRLDGIFTNQLVFLEDKEKHLLHDLKTGPYHFTTGKGNYNSRFQLKFTNTTLDMPEHTQSDDVVVYQFQNKLVIKTNNEPIQKIEVFDMLGQLLFEDSTATTTLRLQNFKPNNQVLILRISTENRLVTKKILF